MADRGFQLNVRLGERGDLLEAIKLAAESEGMSVNAWLIKALESAVGMESSAPVSEEIESAVAFVLDKLLAVKLASIKEMLKEEIVGESVA